NVIEKHQENILSDKGLSVLAACSAVDTAAAPREGGASLFTQSFVEACKKMASDPVDWVYLPRIYEELRYASSIQQPRLIGDNNMFPICRGAGKQVVEPIRISIASMAVQAVEVRRRERGQVIFCGLLVIPSFRAWLLMMDSNNLPKDCERVGPGVY